MFNKKNSNKIKITILIISIFIFATLMYLNLLRYYVPITENIVPFGDPFTYEIGYYNFLNIINNGDLLDADYPEEFILYQNYPNPFNPTTNIEFSIIENSYVKLEIFDIQGKHINTLISDYLTSGFYTVQWDSRNFNNKIVPSGKKLTLIK